jgi:hypothetical protein
MSAGRSSQWGVGRNRAIWDVEGDTISHQGYRRTQVLPGDILPVVTRGHIPGFKTRITRIIREENRREKESMDEPDESITPGRF